MKICLCPPGGDRLSHDMALHTPARTPSDMHKRMRVSIEDAMQNGMRVSLVTIGTCASLAPAGRGLDLLAHPHASGLARGLHLTRSKEKHAMNTLSTLHAITSQLGAAYMTEHGDLLCHACTDRNRGQLSRAGIALELIPCSGVVLCTLCDRPATD